MILLLENKITRAKNSKINFGLHTGLLEIILSDEKCNIVLDNFLINHDNFEKYETIIIHEGIYREEKRMALFKSLESYSKSKNLVLFSGNNSQVTLSDIKLQISAENLYINLEDFLKKSKMGNSNILMLAYGKYWDLNPLLNNLEKLNLFIANLKEEQEVRSSKFKKDFGLFHLTKILKEEEYQLLVNNLKFENQKVSLLDMRILVSNFETLIQEKSNG